MEDIFFAIGIMVIIATLFSYLARIVKQPMIPAYIVAGIILGPVLGIIINSSIIRTLSEIGIAFLLFITGLELDLRKLKEVGVVSSFGGLIQVISVFAFTFLIAVMMRFTTIEAIYLGIIIALSSTMVVVKILSDKQSIDTLHGKITIGILIMQDIIAIVALSLLKSMESFSLFFLVISLIKALLLIGFIFLLARFIVSPLFKTAAKNQELLFLLAITFLFFSSLLFQHIGDIMVGLFSLFNVPLSSQMSQSLGMGFSIAIGAFAAGVGMANLPFTFQIIGQIKPLRDFFSTIFFVSLGLELTSASLNSLVGPLLVFFILVVLLKPLIIFGLTVFFGYTKKTAFFTGLSLGQVSEFSLILVAQGILLGYIPQQILTITILLAILSIIFTSYIVNYDVPFYLAISPRIKSFDTLAEHTANLEYIPKRRRYEVIICGYSRIGFSIEKKLRELRKKILIIDFNPDIIRKLMKEKIPCMFGDVGNGEVLQRLDFSHANIIISTVPTLVDNEVLIERAKRNNKDITVIVTANQIDEALKLYERGADYVILPHFLGGKHVSMMIEDYHSNLKKLFHLKIAHIEELKERKSLGHEHPLT